jgi:hypothetical protein
MKTYKHTISESAKRTEIERRTARSVPIASRSQGVGSNPENFTALQQSIGNRAIQRTLEQLNSETPIPFNEVFRQTKPRTKKEARALVPAHVMPRDCFIWYLNNREGWGPIPGTGCAHWVAHQMGITNGSTCNDGYSFRVGDVISGKDLHPLTEAQVGDIWTNVAASHTGIVRAVKTDPKTKQVTQVQVEHDSSRQGGVVTSWFTSGNFYR